MNLKEQIMADVKSAMKNKEQDKLATLRFLHSAIKYREIELRPNDINDNEIIGVLKKLAKQRQDSIEQFEKAGRTDLSDKEKYELSVLETYLPAKLSEDKVRAIIEEVIAEVQASTIKDMGKVMKAVGQRTQGAADNKMVSEIVKEKLQ